MAEIAQLFFIHMSQNTASSFECCYGEKRKECICLEIQIR